MIHWAVRVLVMNESEADSLAAFRRANVQRTLRLSEQAAQTAGRRFVYLSSMKANGDGTLPGRPYTVDDQPAPQDSSGASKRGAEQVLQARASETGVDVVIIRPVLVYGPGSGPAGGLVAITGVAFEQIRATVWNKVSAEHCRSTSRN